MIQKQSLDAKSGDELQLVVFNIGNEEFCVQIMKVQEIIRMANITKIPRASGFVKGLINLRGKIIAVINLNMMLGIQSKEQDEHSRIIVTDVGDTVVGCVVDSVSEVIRIPSSSIETTPAIIANKIGTEYVRGVVTIKDRLLILLELDNILCDNELNKIRNITSDTAVAT